MMIYATTTVRRDVSNRIFYFKIFSRICSAMSPRIDIELERENLGFDKAAALGPKLG
jgi:hypothetical protein